MESADRSLKQRYLGILDVKERPPSVSALEEILQAHLRRIPFENISKLYHRNVRRRTDLVDLATYLHDIEHFAFGGTCYALNNGLYRLLTWLGYQVRLCGADMSEPDVHVVVVATVERSEYLLDVGYGGPFSEPIPLLLGEPRSVVLGRERYEFSFDVARGRIAMAHHRDGEYRHGYSVNPRGRDIGEFRDIIGASFNDDATFMNALLVIRYTHEGSEVLHNMRFLETRHEVTTTRMLGERAEVVELAAERFAMPRSIVEELIADLPMRKDPYS